MTIEQFRLFLNISEDDTSYDTTILSLYELAKKTFTQRTRVSLAPLDQVDTYIDFSSDVIYTYSTPINAITSINYASTLTEAPSTLSSNYVVLDGAIYLGSLLSAKIVQVTYNSGYSVIPDEIEQILMQIVNFVWNYDNTKIFISGNGEAILTPDQVVLPKYIQDSIAIYRIGI